MLLLVNDNLDAFDVEAAMPLLSEQRRGKIALLANADDRRESAAAYMLLREALSKKYSLADAPIFEYGDYGNRGNVTIVSLEPCKWGFRVKATCFGQEIDFVAEFGDMFEKAAA